MRIRQASRVTLSSRSHPTSSEALITAAVLAALAFSLPAQRQFDELRKRGLPADRDASRSAANGDVDGDGDLDLVIGNGGNSAEQNRLYLNDGQGHYTDATAARMPVVADRTSAVSLGDVDGDGDLDLVCGNFGRNRLYLNDGTGTFSDATAARMPWVGGNDVTLSAALGDVDGDGDLDMVFGNGPGNGEQNRLHLNDGRGTFIDATAARLPIDKDETFAVALGDVDSDGDLDLVFGNRTGQNRLYRNDGTGTFSDATAAHMPTDSDQTHAVAMGDVDGDGDRDIVFGNGGKARLYLNDGTGTFTDVTATRIPANSGSRAVAMGDIDGDGDLDMVFGGPNRLYLNSGTGAYTDVSATRMPVGSDPTVAVVLGDLDGDSDLDLVLANTYQQNRHFVNDSTGTFTDATKARLPVISQLTGAVAMGDLDGDGDLDLVFGHDGGYFTFGSNRLTYGAQNRLFLNDGTGIYSDATAQLLPAFTDLTAAIAVGDVDGDGDLDLVLGNQPICSSAWNPCADGQNRLLLNDGTGRFRDATAARMPVDDDYTEAVDFGDVDGDGDLDLVFGNSRYYTSQRNRLYLNDGTGTFTDVTVAQLPVDADFTKAVRFGDVDGDGDLDLILGNNSGRGTANYARRQNRLYLNDGTGTFTDATAAQMPIDSESTSAVAVGDVDGEPWRRGWRRRSRLGVRQR